MWQWLSMPPGSTSFPAASMVFFALSPSFSSTIFSPDADVGAKRFFRRDDGSAADHQIEGHARFCYNSRPSRP